MTREEKFINYLEGLKSAGNAELLESISIGFKSLLEYRVGGSPSEKSVDIMESEDDILSAIDIGDDIGSDSEMIDEDIPLDESTSAIKSSIYGKNSSKARNAAYQEEQKEGMRAGIKKAGANLGAAAEMWNRQQESYGKKRLDESGGVSEEGNTLDEPMLEVGESELKGKLSSSLLRLVDDLVETKIRKMSDMIDRQKLVTSEDQKVKYLDAMRGNLWRENLLEKGIDPSTAKGLIPSINESLEDANAVLLDFVDTAFKIFSIDRIL